MDNLTHTLVGAALAEAGLKRRTALGAATLMIGANFPDIDVVAVPLGVGLGFRRGATHGVLALAILPFVLAGIMWLWDAHVRRRRDPSATPANFRQLAILSGLAILTHPTLDFMNTYGMRWLMPFVDKWFYADGLFIVDLWILVGLATGVILSRRRASVRPARIALGVTVAYILANLTVTGIGRQRVAARHPATHYMVGPAPLVPWRREIVIEDSTGYRFWNYSLITGLEVSSGILSKGDSSQAVALAKQDPTARAFLHWARFPFYRVRREGNSTIVEIRDARYGEAGWASTEVRLP